MTEADTDIRLQWTPPPRPDWVSTIIEEGHCMNIGGVVPLTAQSLIDSAVRTTGLSDFGADDWREHFEVYTRALEEEADLNLIGRLRTRSEILQLLEARLHIEDTYTRHPEIAEQEIVQPVFIIGQGRSGTSFLQNVLGSNPDNGVMMHWEGIFPCPPPEAATYYTDERIARAHRLIDQWNRVTPTIPTMHELGGDMPFEDCLILAMNFNSSWLDCLGQVPSYNAYIMGQDILPTLRYHERALKLLQWRNPRRHWVLKDPLHLDRLAPLLEIYPDARFVWPHRDPVRALASVISFAGTIQWGRTDHPFSNEGWQYLTNPEFSAGRLDAVIDQLDSGVIPDGQICHILYQDLVNDTIGTIEQMYRQLGITLTSEGSRAMTEYLQRSPRDNRPPHRFSIGSDAALARARRAYERYQRHFGVPTE